MSVTSFMLQAACDGHFSAVVISPAQRTASDGLFLDVYMRRACRPASVTKAAATWEQEASLALFRPSTGGGM